MRMSFGTLIKGSKILWCSTTRVFLRPVSWGENVELSFLRPEAECGEFPDGKFVKLLSARGVCAECGESCPVLELRLPPTRPGFEALELTARCWRERRWARLRRSPEPEPTLGGSLILWELTADGRKEGTLGPGNLFRVSVNHHGVGDSLTRKE